MVQIFKRANHLIVTLGLIVVLLISYAPAPFVAAAVNSCSAEATPQTIIPGQETTFQFRINNPAGQGNDPIEWIKITRPSSNYSIESVSSSGWNGSTASDTALLTSGTLDAGTVLTASVTSAVANIEAPDNSWQVEVSSDPGGVDPTNCGGSLDSTISNGMAPVISNINASAITPNSATINWTTDEPATSLVNYDLTSDYNNSSDYDSNLVTSHSVELSGLFAGIGYHFNVSSDDGAGDGTTSDDNTFVTAEKPPIVVTNTITVPGIAVQVTNPADKTPPTIAITTSLPKIVQTIPTIKGTAADDEAVARIEYSTDGGINWLPADTSSGLGTKAVNFSFTPLNLDDGNYSILARAIDGGGNITATAPIDIVVDQLPPLVGGNIVSIGPQVLEPNANGVITAQTGVDEKITISAVGGATSINLIAQNLKDPKNTKSFSLTQSIDSGLWSGILSFGKPGTYSLVANAVDGAANKTSKTISSVSVSTSAQTLKQGTKQPVVADVTVYYLQPDSDNWVVWDGAAYSQTNPQTTSKDGSFSLFLPAGQYYLKASAKGYHSLSSTIFKLSQPTPVLTTLNMKPGRDLKLGPVDLSAWDFLSHNVKLNLGEVKPSESNSQNSLVGRPLPNFNLTDTNGHAIHAADLLGKPTLVSLLSTWAPTVSEQLGPLSQLQKNPDINIEPVALQQDTGQAVAYDQIAGYNLTWLTDPNSTLTNLFSAPSLPTNYFIDRQGIVRQVISGVLTKQEILNNLSNL